jgi:hypothetical protein
MARQWISWSHPGAYHDFDDPEMKHGVATTDSGQPRSARTQAPARTPSRASPASFKMR